MKISKIINYIHGRLFPTAKCVICNSSIRSRILDIFFRITDGMFLLCRCGRSFLVMDKNGTLIEYSLTTSCGKSIRSSVEAKSTRIYEYGFRDREGVAMLKYHSIPVFIPIDMDKNITKQADSIARRFRKLVILK